MDWGLDGRTDDDDIVLNEWGSLGISEYTNYSFLARNPPTTKNTTTILCNYMG